MIARLARWLGVLAWAVLPRSAEAQRGDVHLLWGVHASYPEYATLSIGASSGVWLPDNTRQAMLFLLEPGLNGGRVLLARETSAGGGSWISGLSVMQTWNNPPGTLPNVTYLSTETRLTLNGFLIGAGIGFRVAGGTTNTPFGGVSQPGAQSLLISGVMGAHFEF